MARCSISKRYTKSSNTLDNNDPHNGTTMFLQAVCDTRLKFLDVSTSDPNNILPESGISNPCFIGKDLAKMCSPQYHLLGNDLYPLREYLLTPYPEKEFLSDSEKNYNEKFMETYESINRALNILKSRFRQLTKTLEFTNVEIMSQFIVSCCVLHNICIDRDDFHYAQTTNELVDIHTGPQKSDDLGDLGLLQLGHFKRNETKEHLFILTKD